MVYHGPKRGSFAILRCGLGELHMNIHEYQAKALLHEFGVAISKVYRFCGLPTPMFAAKTLPARSGW